jgi:hypothetical protein
MSRVQKEQTQGAHDFVMDTSKTSRFRDHLLDYKLQYSLIGNEWYYLPLRGEQRARSAMRRRHTDHAATSGDQQLSCRIRRHVKLRGAPGSLSPSRTWTTAPVGLPKTFSSS